MGWYRWIYCCACSHPVTNEWFQHVGLATETVGNMETVHPMLLYRPFPYCLLQSLFVFFPSGTQMLVFKHWRSLGASPARQWFPVLSWHSDMPPLVTDGRFSCSQLRSLQPRQGFLRSLVPQGRAWGPLSSLSSHHKVTSDFVSNSEKSELICLTCVLVFLWLS